MEGRKNVIWENDLGQKLIFDNVKFYVESIDMTGNSCTHTTSSLADADGQATTGHRLEPKTIPCSFALFDDVDDDYVQRLLTQCFFPKIHGRLTVRTETSVYTIDCYPQNEPVFKKDPDLPIFRWDVDFVADYPYWNKGVEHSVSLNSNYTVIDSRCVYDIPVKIRFPAEIGQSTVKVESRRKPTDAWTTEVDAFTVKGSLNGVTRDFALTIDTRTLKITDDSGNNVNQWVDVTAAIDKVVIKYGQTGFLCTISNTATERPVMTYYELSQGEA